MNSIILTSAAIIFSMLLLIPTTVFANEQNDSIQIVPIAGSTGVFVGEYETDEEIPYKVFRDFVVIEQLAPDQSRLEFNYKGDPIIIGIFTTENKIPSELMIPILYRVF